MKRLTRCPVGRINVETLHETALYEIDRAARHKTVMHRIIAQSGGWQKPDDARKALRGQTAKKRQFNGLQIANINKAVAGGNFRSLLTTLKKLKEEENALRQELQNVEAEIEQMTMKRPTAE